MDFPKLLASPAYPSRINVHHGRAPSEFLGHFGNQLGVAHGRGIDADFFSPSLDQPRRVFERPDSPTHCEGHEDFFGHSADHVKHDVPALVAGADIEKDQLIRALGLITSGHFHRIARVAEVEEVDSFHHASTVHVQTGDDPLGEHRLKERSK